MPTPSHVTKPAVSAPANNPMIGLESMSDAQRHVHDILNDLTTVMMITHDDAPESGVRGEATGRSGMHARPMSIARLDPDGTLWFVTAIDSPKVGEAEANSASAANSVSATKIPP